MILRWLLCVLALTACGSKRAKPVDAVKPVAIAIVFEGWEMWIGNDQLPDVPDDERDFGVLKPFKDAFARVELTGLPAGSKATVVTYAEHASVRHPMQPIEKLTGAAFGEQKDYFGTVDRNLVGGVTAALDELAKVPDARRVLVVIGDGTDTNSDTAKPALAELAKRAAAENVEIATFIYQAQLSPSATVVGALDPIAVRIHSVDGIVAQLNWLFARLQQPPVAARTGKLPLALAFLMSGSEIWLGNDDFTPPDDPTRYEGAFKSIKAAFDKAPMSGLPRGAAAMFATYATSAKVRLPMTPVENIDARALGGQLDYRGSLGSDLVDGVTLALTELLKVDAERRVLVIVGDGADTSFETAKGRLRELAKQTAASHIETYAIVYKSVVSLEDTVVTVLDPNAPTVKSTDEITAQLVALFAKLRTK